MAKAGRKPKPIKTAKFSHNDRDGIEITEIDKMIVSDFLETGQKKATLEKYYGKGNFQDYEIYYYFRRPSIQNLIKEMGEGLKVHLEQFDETLVNIVNSPRTQNRDKIAAIKLFNEIYKRVESQKVELNIGAVNDDDLEDMVKKILNDNTTTNN